MKNNSRACRAILPLLWNHAEATLSPGDRERVEMHLTTCKNCTAQAQACRQTVLLMQKGRTLPLPDTTNWQTLCARLDNEPAPVRHRPLWYVPRPVWVWSGAAAALSLAVVGLSHRGGEPKPAPLPVAAVPFAEQKHAVSVRGGATATMRPIKVPHGTVASFKGRFIPQNGIAPIRTNVPKQQEASPVSLQDDMAYLNARLDTAQSGLSLPAGQDAAMKANLDRILQIGDDFVTVSFPQIASRDDKGLAAAAQAYKQEKEIIDARLVRKVTIAARGMAFVDFCKHLRSMTGIEIIAGRSIANEKLTVFCKDQSLRDLMRQMRQVFGFIWLRSGEEGAFRYEFAQSMRRQLEEEELCNRDRAEALLDLNAQIENYRKNLELSPQEAAAKYEAATGEEKHLLWAHEMNGSGPMQLFLSLAPEELDALRNGQQLKFSGSPEDKERPLPPGIGERLLNYPESFRILLTDNSSQFGPPNYVPDGKPLTEFSGLVPTVHLSIQEPEPGHFELIGGAGVRIPGRAANQMDVADNNTVIAHGLSPSIRNPQNAVVNAAQKPVFQRDPALKDRVTIQPKATCTLPAALYEQDRDGPRVTSADVLETLHKVTGQNIVADYFTRVYEPGDVSVVNASLFDALCRLADAMRMRWKRESGWLQFRSTGYFNEKRMEVSNIALSRWAASRREHDALTLNDLTEIAQLSDTQLNSGGMSSGARAVFGLTEWHIARNLRRPDLRFFALLTPQQRDAAKTERGLPFAEMSAAQQAKFCDVCLGGSFATAEQVEGASFRVRYLPPAPKTEKEKQAAAKLSALSDTDPDKRILQASAARIGTWKAQDEALLQCVYRYLGGRGKRLNDNYGFSQEYDGKIFGD